MKKILLTSALCASVMFAASNPSNQYNYEVTAFTSGILTDTKSEITNDNYFNGGISLSKNLKDLFIDQVELGFMRSQNLDFRGAGTGSTNSNRYFINALKHYGLTDQLAAYGLAGIGFQDLDQELNDTEDSPFVNYGIGLRYDIPYYGIALKGDIRHLISTKNSQNDFMYTFGLAMPLGKKLNNEIIAPVVPKIVEEIPKKIVVDGDDDNDGVLNSKDLCPNTIAGAIVDKNGCEIDDDNDGVINRLDKCPNTSAGVKVNSEGCVATVDLNINFDSNSTKIKSQYANNLEDFAKLLKENNKLNATIEAHTDSRGSSKYNQKLSEKRAQSAVKALEEKGIESARLNAIGYGESQPIATNDTAEGRAENRRVTGLINQ